METLAIIPARSGSKGIPHKNITMFHGNPMLSYSVIQACQAKKVDRVILSTDSKLYADIARQYGAETPFLRPAEISKDASTDLEVFEHSLKWLDKNEGYCPDICVHLRPTYPTRQVNDIDRAIELLESDSKFDSVRSVILAPETPFKMWFLSEDHSLSPVIQSDIPEAYNMPRQSLPQTYLQTANVDVTWAKTILKKHSMTGDRIRAMVMDDFNDIDSMEQLIQATQSTVCGPLTGKRFVFDIDGVIATLTPDNDYGLAEPIDSNIQLINRLYDMSNTIILHTARGNMTGIDWTEQTKAQMNCWGVKYNELLFEKPAGDYYIDDRFIGLDKLKSLVNTNDSNKRKG